MRRDVANEQDDCRMLLSAIYRPCGVLWDVNSLNTLAVPTVLE
jgi:hypothetical protein